MGRRKFSDEERLFNLFQATAPHPDEHRLAFTVRFSHVESERLKATGSNYITEALETFKYLIHDNSEDISPAIDIVLIVERNKKRFKSLPQAPYGVHAHG